MTTLNDTMKVEMVWLVFSTQRGLAKKTRDDKRNAMDDTGK
jgi:hypothetical protein